MDVEKMERLLSQPETWIALVLIVLSILFVFGGNSASKGPPRGPRVYDGSQALDPEEYRSFELQEKTEVNHDTRIYRFALQSKKTVLGLPIGQHISLRFHEEDENGEEKAVSRSYTPISSDDELGYVDFCIKTYFPGVVERFPDGGKMSMHLERMQVGETIEMRGPKGHLEYLGEGWFSIRHKKEVRTVHVDNIGMVAGGTGITPMHQIMTAVCKEITASRKNGADGSSLPRMSLVFANKSTDDILMRDELMEQEQAFDSHLRLWFTVDALTEEEEKAGDWKYSTGYVNDTMFEAHLPPPSPSTVILMCGPPPMLKFACKPALDKLGYDENMIFSF